MHHVDQLLSCSILRRARYPIDRGLKGKSIHSPGDLARLQIIRERPIIPDYVKESIMVERSVAKKEKVGWLPAVSRLNAYRAKWIYMIIVRVLRVDVNFKGRIAWLLN